MHRHHLHPLQHTIYHLQRYSSLLPCYLASRTMTNQFLAVKMVESIGEIGIINHRLRLLKQKSDEKLTVDEKASLSEGQKHKKKHTRENPLSKNSIGKYCYESKIVP